MKILISGGGSKFSKELQKQNKIHELIPLSKEEMDITDILTINAAIEKYNPEVFIHTAALSRPMDVHNENPYASISLNINGTSNCVMSCISYNIKFVYISTDYVYPGIHGNYSERDPILPINKYAWSKLGGECACMLYDNSLILRMAMIEEPFPHKKAFVDCYKSSIWYSDAASITLKLIELNKTGIFNIGNEKKSIYNFVLEKDNKIKKELKNNISEKVPDDISMNLFKIRSLNESCQ